MATCQFIVAGVGTGAGIENTEAQRALIAFVCIYIFFCEYYLSRLPTQYIH